MWRVNDEMSVIFLIPLFCSFLSFKLFFWFNRAFQVIIQYSFVYCCSCCCWWRASRFSTCPIDVYYRCFSAFFVKNWVDTTKPTITIFVKFVFLTLHLTAPVVALFWLSWFFRSLSNCPFPPFSRNFLLFKQSKWIERRKEKKEKIFKRKYILIQ